MSQPNLLTNNLIIGVTNVPKTNQRVQKYIQTLRNAQEGQERQEDVAQNKMFITDELKTQIKSTFEYVCEKVGNDLQNEIDFSPYQDSDKFDDEIKQRAKEEIVNNFEDWDSWIDDEENYEANKVEIINFINEL